MLVFPDPEPSIIKFFKDGQECKANLDCYLFRLSHHNFSSAFKICHYKFNHYKKEFLLQK